MENTFWTDEFKDRFPHLEHDIEAEAVIVGGGLAGLMCAEALVRRGVKDICILEAEKIGAGETARSSAMVSFAHDLVYDRMIKKHGEERAREYLTRNREGLERIRDIVAGYDIDCDFTDCDMVLYATSHAGAAAIERERRAYGRLGVETQYSVATELPFSVTAALRIQNQAHLNPYRFALGLSHALNERGVRFFENTPVSEQPDDGVLEIGELKVYAKQFIWATHYPFLNFPGFYFLKMYQSRSFNVVFESELPLKNIYEAAENRGFEYRPCGENLILCGGGVARTGKYKRGSCFGVVERHVQAHFGAGGEQIRARFSAQDCMTSDGFPFAGRYSGMLADVYVVTGFNKWGFTNSAACAEIVARMILGVRGQGLGVRGQGLGIRDQGSGIRGQGLGVDQSVGVDAYIGPQGHPPEPVGADAHAGSQGHPPEPAPYRLDENFMWEAAEESAAGDARRADIPPYIMSNDIQTGTPEQLPVDGYQLSFWEEPTAQVTNPQLKTAKCKLKTPSNPFDPGRFYTLKSPVKSARNIATIAAGWFSSLFSPDAKRLDKIKNGEGAIVKHKGKRYGVYKDESGQIHAIDAVCPHLGCALKWNRDDRSWDCPCHGSRFDTWGNILNNPTIKKAETVEL
ncbi:MAG: FAD-dependent oxidoreductase [Firmicutes bacterium]|nr:FAD-dependent oxidoreductase [Bacillota bacterium]